VRFLRGIFGGDRDAPDGREESEAPDMPSEDAGPDNEAEQQRDLDVLRDEQRQFDDLTQRQQRYAQYAWQPPPQGGDRRADDPDPTPDDAR
jgi:hypothetical protein